MSVLQAVLLWHGVGQAKDRNEDIDCFYYNDSDAIQAIFGIEGNSLPL